jgi:hypothetical protein
MDTLQYYVKSKNLDPKRVLNALQNYGVVSDLCITLEEVGDSGKAVAWLEQNQDKLREQN